MSARADIINRYITVLDATTGITSVHSELKHHEELGKDQFPAVFPIDGDEAKTKLCYFSTTYSDDMASTMSVIVTCYVYDETTGLIESRLSLMQDIEQAIMTDTSLGRIADPVPIRIVTDDGQIPKYSIFDIEFENHYMYNHATGG